MGAFDQDHFKLISRYDIVNVLIDKYVPLSDDCYGPYRIMPPKLLHTSGSGLILYMFESLHVQIGCGKDRDVIDEYHIQISLIIRRQSEHVFPHGAMHNGLLNWTKCQAEERRGNLFLLLCITQTLEGSEKLQKGLQYSQHKWAKWQRFLKLYLSMEEWFQDANNKVEVVNAKPLIGEVLQTFQALFPREDKTNGYCIPKMHGMT